MQALITDTQRMLYQSAGHAVQVYSQDLLMQKLNQAFTRCFEAKFWPQFDRRVTRTLDGATGQPTVPFSDITSWEDVDRVFRKNSPHPIPVLPRSYNILDLPATTNVRFIEPTNDTTLFTAYPLTSTDQISVVGRARPVNAGNFLIQDEVPFDFLALEFSAAWEYAIDDASNAALASKFQGLYEQRMNQLQESSFDDIVLLAPRANHIPQEWH
jgi:hypothetical protein